MIFGKSTLVAGIFLAALISPALALEIQFPDHSSYQENTPYGTLIFNQSADTVGKNRRLKRFVRIGSNGEVKLPQQDGYCFYLNHFKEVNDGRQRRYSVTVTKYYSGTIVTELPVKRTFRPTGRLGSNRGPDYCVEEVRDTNRIKLEFSSDAGRAFLWKISFTRTPRN